MSLENPPAQLALRVLVIVESSGGGTGRHVLDLAEGLLARGCQVHMIYSTKRMDRLFRDRLHAIPSLKKLALNMHREIHPTDLAALVAVCRYMRAAGPFDIIHGHASKGGAMARLAGFLSGVPVFYTVHGLIMMDPLLPPWKRILYLSIERILASVTARIIAVSPEEARAAAALRLGTSRIRIVANGVGKANLVSRGTARAAMAIPDNATVVGFIGRLVTQKAPEVLLDAFFQAAASLSNTYLAMIGSGPLDQELRRRADELGITDKVRWLGERDAREFMGGFDIFALASRKEGLPYVILEAMAAGLPVVATSSAGVESLLQNGENGLVVPPENPAALAEALRSLLRDPALRADFGRASLRRVAHFSIEAMVDGILRLYRAAPRLDFDQPPAGRETRPQGASL